jgi:hypothetical protein
MRCRLVLLQLLVLTFPAPAIPAGDMLQDIDIRNIAARPAAPEFAFARFFATYPLQQPTFSADNRQLYFSQEQRSGSQCVCP